MIKSRMGFLELDGNPVKDDNMFQRLFWPSDHAGEADYLGKQGFWVCMIVALIGSLGSAYRGHPFIAMLLFIFYALGGIGVREHSVAAAVLVAADYWIENIFAISQGHFPGILSIAAGVMLLANIRGTYIAAKWARTGDPEAFPERGHQTVSERFADQMPPYVWPKARIPFYAVAGVYMMMTIVGVFVLATRPPRPAQPPADTQQLDVAPPR